MLSNDLLALIITFVLSLIWLRINNYAAQRGWVSSDLSRKIIHMGTGPLFVLCWLLFSQAAAARYLAATVPLLITLQFILVGIGVIKDESAVQAMSRTGDRREILRGPLYYGIIFIAMTLIYWKDSPIGMVALMMMCGGDGLADVVGRRWGKARLPWNPGKSWAGSAAMLLGGWFFAAGILAAFVAARLFPAPLSAYLPGLTLIALASTAVESFPLNDIDNITITLTAAGMGHLFF